MQGNTKTPFRFQLQFSIAQLSGVLFEPGPDMPDMNMEMSSRFVVFFYLCVAIYTWSGIPLSC
ncbi:hypothetical protein AAC03nite_09940 [Alicyclobacillus acidoterrestris]|nr:hypothetical protein AAC03nite_09940 [Alicyclobacillus acidoterrestris]